MKKGFTLLELIIVIIIIGVLATLGFTQYTRMVEKGRIAEAKAILGFLRTLEIAYYQENDTYAEVNTTYGDQLGTGLPADVIAGSLTPCTDTRYYFRYGCDASSKNCFAYRCQTGGKKPPVGNGQGYWIGLYLPSGKFFSYPSWVQ